MWHHISVSSLWQLSFAPAQVSKGTKPIARSCQSAWYVCMQKSYFLCDCVNFILVTDLNSTFQHPFIHPVERIDYLVDHRLLVMVQSQRNDGSLKDTDGSWVIPWRVLEKIKPHQQKGPKGRPVGGVNHEDDGHMAGLWKDWMPRQIATVQQLFSRKKERYPIS